MQGTANFNQVFTFRGEMAPPSSLYRSGPNMAWDNTSSVYAYIYTHKISAKATSLQHFVQQQSIRSVHTVDNSELIADSYEASTHIAIVPATVGELNVSYDQTLTMTVRVVNWQARPVFMDTSVPVDVVDRAVFIVTVSPRGVSWRATWKWRRTSHCYLNNTVIQRRLCNKHNKSLETVGIFDCGEAVVRYFLSFT